MTRKENLIALRDAVVNGDTPSRAEFRSAGFMKVATLEFIRLALLDDDLRAVGAALDFVAEVLPKWVVHRIGQKYGGTWCAELMKLSDDGWHYDDDPRAYATSTKPDRALLIAALNALIEETDE